jgi:hypothetical protein
VCFNILRNSVVWLIAILALALSAKSVNAQGQPAAGLYRIVSGTYATCCGIAGPAKYSLPNTDQGFFRLSIDPQSNLARMTFLDDRHQNTFSVTVCPPYNPIPFDFGYGFVVADSIVFHVDPGPPPLNLFWNYTVSNSANGLRIDGQVGINPGSCADVPNQFYHSNVVAVLVPQPKLTLTDFTDNIPSIMIQGQTGTTNVLEASTDFLTWVGLSTNVMPNTDCLICPFILYRDTAATNLASRFYRAVELH